MKRRARRCQRCSRRLMIVTIWSGIRPPTRSKISRPKFFPARKAYFAGKRGGNGEWAAYCRRRREENQNPEKGQYEAIELSSNLVSRDESGGIRRTPSASRDPRRFRISRSVWSAASSAAFRKGRTLAVSFMPWERDQRLLTSSPTIIN